MSRLFSIPTVLRMMPRGLLRQILAKLGHDNLNVPWHACRQRDVLPIAEALRQLPADRQSVVETVLRDTFDLACDNGLEAIREASGDLSQQEVVPYLPEAGGPYGVAAWAWLHYPEIFDRALLLQQVDSLGRWRKRKGMPRVEPNTTASSVARLEARLAELLRKEQGRGARCTVEHVLRSDGTDYFFAYLDDFVHMITMHDVDGKLAPRTLRQTFEIVFAYRRENGALETHARVPSRLKPRLEQLFCQVILGGDLETGTREAAYDLDVLKERQFELPIDPKDCQSVRINRVRLAISNNRRNIILEADRRGPPDDMRRMVYECLNEERVSLENARITSAQIQMRFYPFDHRKRNSLTFDVTSPNLCSLRNERSDRAALAADYLRRWRIARD
jgi:hypothetical protein